MINTLFLLLFCWTCIGMFLGWIFNLDDLTTKGTMAQRIFLHWVLGPIWWVIGIWRALSVLP